MKMIKLLALLCFLILPLKAFAFDNCNLTLKKNEAYMLFIDERPTQMSVSMPKVLSTQLASDLYNVSYHIVIKTYSTGNAEILINTAKGNQYTVKVKVEADPIISSEVFEIDAPPESPLQ